MKTNDFIAYPTNCVVGTITDAAHTRAAIEELSRAGFAASEIDVLHGEKDLHRLDPTGEEHGFFARFQRTLIRSIRLEEYKHLIHHVDDVRAGRFVVMVHTKKPVQRDVAAKILSAEGAEFIVFYGRWMYEALDGHYARSRGLPAR